MSREPGTVLLEMDVPETSAWTAGRAPGDPPLGLSCGMTARRAFESGGISGHYAPWDQRPAHSDSMSSEPEIVQVGRILGHLEIRFHGDPWPRPKTRVDARGTGIAAEPGHAC